MNIVKISEELRPEIKSFFIKNWNTDFMISRGRLHKVEALDGFVAMNRNEIIGLITYCIDNNELEIVSLDSLIENIGVGSKLVSQLLNDPALKSLDRIWLITTNDNLNALKFYQKRSFCINNIYINAVAEARSIKPSIPEKGYYNIPIQHEIELTYRIV